MWEVDRTKVNVAGLDAEGNRLTGYASAILSAHLFGGSMYVAINTVETSKVENTGTITQIGIYDHCGHLYKTMKSNDPVEVRPKRFGDDTVTWSNLKITLHGDIT